MGLNGQGEAIGAWIAAEEHCSPIAYGVHSSGRLAVRNLCRLLLRHILLY